MFDWSEKERARFSSNIVSGDGCWKWNGRTLNTSRGQFQARNKRLSAPRVAYSMFCDAIPRGMVVMHSCDNPNCVNPAHLSVGTQQENIADRDVKGRNRLSHTHCVNGHVFSPENTRHYGPEGRWRMCRACGRENQRKFRITRLEAENY